mgnify:CR=1 FL=1
MEKTRWNYKAVMKIVQRHDGDHDLGPRLSGDLARGTFSRSGAGNEPRNRNAQGASQSIIGCSTIRKGSEMTLKQALDLYRAGLLTVIAVQNKERVTLYILKGQ